MHCFHVLKRLLLCFVCMQGGETALYWAAKRNHPEVAALLKAWSQKVLMKEDERHHTYTTDRYSTTREIKEEDNKDVINLHPRISSCR
jgi:hypothetical protein